MSIEAMNWCRNQRGVRGSNKAVLFNICDRYNDRLGYAWPTIARMADDSGLSARTVTRALRWLESREYIVTYRQEYARDGSPASNRYYLPEFGPLPERGTIFLVGGDFNYDGTWDPSLDSGEAPSDY